ncbi:MAG: hemin uptake protein HemP [Mesorhizobium sp.]
MNTYNPQFHRALRNDRSEVQRPLDAGRIGVRTLSSTTLFERGEHEIGIAHGESLYRLKITRQGKLILNK